MNEVEVAEQVGRISFTSSFPDKEIRSIAVEKNLKSFQWKVWLEDTDGCVYNFPVDNYYIERRITDGNTNDSSAASSAV